MDIIDQTVNSIDLMTDLQHRDMLLFDLTEREDFVNVLNVTACFILCDYVKLF
jgi:hypothetical protein